MKSPIILTALLLLAKKGCEVLAQRVDCLKQSTPALCATSYLQPTGQISIPAVIKPLISPVEPGLATPIVPSYADYGSYSCMPAMPMPPVIIARDNDDDWQHLMYFLIFALTRNRGGSGCGYSNGNSGCGGNCGCGGNGYSGNCYGDNGCSSNCYGGNGCNGNCFGNNCYGGNNCGSYGCGDYGFGGGSGGSSGGFSAYDSFSNFGGNYGNGGGYDVNNNGINLNNGGNGVMYVPYPIPIPMNSQYFGPSFPYPDNAPSSPDFYPSPGSTLPPCNCDCKDSNEITLTIRTDCTNNK